MARPQSFPSSFRLRGLVAATFTPFRADGSLDLPLLRLVIDAVLAQGCKVVTVSPGGPAKGRFDGVGVDDEATPALLWRVAVEEGATLIRVGSALFR